MNRRKFSRQLTLAAACVAVGMPPARAQGGLVAGKDYAKLDEAAPVGAPAGKIDVIEFFWYGCPHCYSLEPMLEQWLQRLPPEVAFRRVPVAFRASQEIHQRIFYTLDAMGQLPAVHRKVFAAIHGERKRMEDEAEIVAFATAQGLDGAKFAGLFKSFSVATKAKQAKQLAEAYHIDGVPAMGVQGRYTTSVGMAGGHERLFAVVEKLIEMARALR